MTDFNFSLSQIFISKIATKDFAQQIKNRIPKT